MKAGPARVIAALLAALSPVLALPSAASAAPVLERVVLVTRHGVRAPTRKTEILNVLTHAAWPSWPVAAGEMTPHGAHDLGLMADYLRSTYVAAGLLPAQGCPSQGTVAIWADGADNRTRQSGDILAARLTPNCGIASRHATSSEPDPIFDASQTKACDVGLLDRAKALAEAARANGGPVRPQDRRALEALQNVLAPGACAHGGAGLCLVPAPDASLAKAASELTVASTTAEAIYLEYVEGFPLKDVGWGRVAGPETIAAIMPLNARGLDILRRTPTLAAARGVVMAQTIVALLADRARPEEAPPLPRDPRLVVFAGHDSNLLYLAGLLGLSWTLRDQPSPTAPDTTLAFELWRDPAGPQRWVRLVIYAQTLAQLREGKPLVGGGETPNVVRVVPEGCPDTADGCPLATFTAAVDRRLTGLCSKP